MRIVFMGSPDFAVPSLRALAAAGYEIPLVVTQPDRAKGRSKKPAPTQIKEAALELGLPLWQPENINTPQSLEKITQAKPDILVVVAFGQILKKPLLCAAPYGAINLHGSLLPKYRGAAPIQWAIINGEKKTGVSTMFLNEGMDTGDIIYKAEIPINEEDNFATLYKGLRGLGAGLLLKTVADLDAAQKDRKPQDDSLASYAPLIKKEHEKINWQKSAIQVCNLIRGLYPQPAAYTNWEGKRLKIGKAAVYEEESYKEKSFKEKVYEEQSKESPGKVLEILPKGPRIACGQGSVILELLQPEGKNMMPAGDFQRGGGLKAGDILGD